MAIELGRVICRIVGHRPYHSKGLKVGPHTYGPGYRYCGRCGQLLDGDLPVIGDRTRV